MPHNGPAQLPDSHVPADRFGTVRTATAGDVVTLSPWHHDALQREEEAARQYRQRSREIDAAFGINEWFGRSLTELRDALDDTFADAEAAYGTPAFHALATRFHFLAGEIESRTGVDPRRAYGC